MLIMLLACASLFQAPQEQARALRAAERERHRRVDALLERDAAVAGASGAGSADSTGSADSVPESERSPPTQRVE